MTLYDVTVEIDQDIPDDVLAEHIGHALREYRAPAKPARNPRVSVRRVTPRLTEPVTYNTGGVITGPEYPLAGDRGHGVFTREQIRALGGANLTYIDEVARRLNRTTKPVVRNHPFEGPEVFDDEITADTIVNTPQDITGEMYPKTAEVLRDLLRREDVGWKPPVDEGDWDLDEGADVGSD